MSITRVDFVELKSQHQALKKELWVALEDVFTRGDFVLGEALSRFEREFARYLGAEHALGVSSGTEALHLAVRACGIGPGDEVIIPANTFIATALAVAYAGGVPRLVDVDETSYNIDPAQLEAAITPQTKAIMPVHLYGQPADMDAVLALAKKHALRVIEDACQAHGALYRGRRVGTLGDVSGFSFYPAKNLGACGDGGAVVTSDAELHQRLAMLRNYGQPKKYYHDIKGFNSRLDTLQAALLSVKLPHLDHWNARRRHLAQVYHENLATAPVRTPKESEGVQSVYHLYVIRTRARDALREYLHARDIETGIHYPVPIHQQACYRALGCPRGDFPVTERLAGEIISLPLYPELSEEKVLYVCRTINEFFKC